MNFQPEQKKNREQKADGLYVSQHRSKPLVIGRPCVSEEFVHLSASEKIWIENSFDKKYFPLMKHGIISPNNYFLCRDFAVYHPPKYHESILRSLEAQSEPCLSDEDWEMLYSYLKERHRNS